MNYYNEIDPYCVQWLKNLIAAGLIPQGDVDDRDIKLVRASDLVGYAQCHFFAGIGGWSRALELAGWPEDRPVWTGSCPCQPFSDAGARRGFSDERHLWPEWRRLIAEHRPPVVFGEQVARASDWLRLVHSDLEALDYAVGSVPIEAASAGARQLRDRYWLIAVAHDSDEHFLAINGEMALARATDSCVDGARLEKSVSRNTRQQPPAFGTHLWPDQSDVGCIAYGVPARVAKLRALGNAIVPQVAAEFIGAYLDVAP